MLQGNRHKRQIRLCKVKASLRKPAFERRAALRVADGLPSLGYKGFSQTPYIPADHVSQEATEMPETSKRLVLLRMIFLTPTRVFSRKLDEQEGDERGWRALAGDDQDIEYHSNQGCMLIVCICRCIIHCLPPISAALSFFPYRPLAS